MRLAYLVSEYPAVSHTFISREIQALRKRGFTVLPATVRACENPGALSQADQCEMEKTFVLQRSLPVTGGGALLKRFFARPGSCAAMFRLARRLNAEGTRNWAKTAAYILEAARLRSWLEREKPDHLHVHFGNVGARVAALACADGAFSYSLSIHGPDDFYELSDNALHLTAGRARFVRAISWFCRSQLLRILPFSHWDRVKIVHCGIPAQAFEPVPEPQGIPEIVCVGRLCVAKAQAVLLESAALLKAAGETFRLTFVGGGPDADRLRGHALQLGLTEEHLRWIGPVPSDQVRGYLAGASIFCLPSFAEGVPMVLMEAMAMERPVVSTAIMGIPELIAHGENGLLAPPGDVAALTQLLASLLHDPALRRRLGEAGRRTVLAGFDADSCGGQMAALFKGL